MRAIIAVGIGGFLGTVCRYLLSLIPVSERTAFPVVTLLINVLGALAIGVLSGLAARYKGASPELMTFLRVGVCGGFTTFSTFALEITGLWGAGRPWMSAAYMALSLILGVVAVLAGKALAS
jgi:CrcB protein